MTEAWKMKENKERNKYDFDNILMFNIFTSHVVWRSLAGVKAKKYCCGHANELIVHSNE